jgi:CO/xanthine dehydrogenase Mo-binding subunit
LISTIGQPVARVEGPEKLSGRARYTADYQVPGMLHGAVLRSPYPHARLLEVYTASARQAPGVHAVISGQDIGERLYGRAVVDIPVLAVDRVRYVGEPVAAVAADDPEAAQAALDLIEAEYEELPAIFDPFAAMQIDAPILHDRARAYLRSTTTGNPALTPTDELPDIPNLCAYELRSWGDVEQGLREADPIEFRLRNAVRDGDPSPEGFPWTSVRIEECLRAVKEAAGWGRAKTPHVGRGIAATEEGAGLSVGGSSSIVEVHPDGTATLTTSVNDQGSGSHTMLTQVVGHELQLPLDRVRLQVTGTDGPWDRGSSAASVTRAAGQATIGAAVEVREKLAAVAAEFLGCPPEQVELVDGRFRDCERAEVGLTFAEVARHACRDGDPLTGFHRYDDSNLSSATTSYVAQVAEVEVDPETGQVQVRRVVTASDVGTVLNAIGVDGQLEGATIMGLGFAVTEELRIAEGRVETTGHHDYKLPTIADIPAFENVLITTGVGEGPYGAKSAGELTHLTMPAAIANAVYDAVGVRVTQLPITAERVYDALSEHTAGT